MRSAPLFLFLVACGASDLQDGSPDSLDPSSDPIAAAPNRPPTARFIFPPSHGALDATAIRVRGTASDPHGVTQVAVNGVPAATTDGFATWEAEVALSAGANELVVETTDALGATAPAAARVTVLSRPTAYLSRPRAIAIESPQHALVVDGELDAVLRVDLATGVRAQLPRPPGSPPLEDAIGMVVQPGAHRALVATRGLGLGPSIVSVDLITGARTVVTGRGAGSGPALDAPTGIALDLAANRALLADGAQLALVAVDLATGARSVLSSGLAARSVAVTGGRALVITDEAARPAVSVDLATGAQTALGAAWELGPQPWGASLSPAIALAPGASPAVAYIGMDGLEEVIALDLATGARTTLPGSSLLRASNDLVLDAPRSRLIALSTFPEALTAIDLATGARTTLGDPQLGRGDALVRQAAAVPLPGPSSWLVLDAYAGAVVRVASDAQRTRVATLTSSLERLVDMVSDPAGQRALVLDRGSNRLLGLPFSTLQPVELSGPSVGSGPSFASPAALALDPSQQRALFVANMEGSASLGAIDLATGARSVVSGGSSSAHLFEASDMAFDPATNRVYVARDAFSSPTCNVIRIDAASGARACLPGLPLASSVLAAGGKLYLGTLSADGTGATILEHDLATSDRRVIAGASVGRGPALQRVEDIIAAPDGLLVLIESSFDSPIVLDPRTGDRIVLARP